METGSTFLERTRVWVHLRSTDWNWHLAGNHQKLNLVFLHFFGGSSRTWEPVMELLSGEFPCHAVDLRGFGRVDEQTRLPTAADEESMYSLDLTAGDVMGFVSNFGINRFVLIGHSMGGKVALATAAGQGCPAGLEALVLIAPSPPTPEPMPDKERARLLAGVGSEAAARETLSKITANPLPPATADKVVEDEVSVRPAAWRAWLERGSRVDISARLERINVPVFLLAGAQDANITPRLLRREIAERLPEKYAREPEVVADASHLLPLEAPAAVADFIRRSLASDKRPGPRREPNSTAT